jgi:hypothetical protein
MTPVPPPSDLSPEAAEKWRDKAARYAARGQVVRGIGLHLFRRYVELEVALEAAWADESTMPDMADVEEHRNLARAFFDTPRARDEAVAAGLLPG